MTDADPDLVARARALRPLIEAEAEEAEATGTTTKRVVDAVAEQQLFWVMVPRAAGGQEASIGTCLGVFEELAYADGSTGWSAMANASSTERRPAASVSARVGPSMSSSTRPSVCLSGPSMRSRP